MGAGEYANYSKMLSRKLRTCLVLFSCFPFSVFRFPETKLMRKVWNTLCFGIVFIFEKTVFTNWKNALLVFFWNIWLFSDKIFKNSYLEVNNRDNGILVLWTKMKKLQVFFSFLVGYEINKKINKYLSKKISVCIYKWFYIFIILSIEGFN